MNGSEIKKKTYLAPFFESEELISDDVLVLSVAEGGDGKDIDLDSEEP